VWKNSGGNAVARARLRFAETYLAKRKAAMTTPTEARALADRMDDNAALPIPSVWACRGAAAALRSAADQLDAQKAEIERQWQPIETAPKDGTRVLAGHFNGRGSNHDGYMVVDYWRKGGHATGFLKFNLEHWPATHWMPLPKAPT
jgi:hypothetical protein